jgi:hypothetical protein
MAQKQTINFPAPLKGLNESWARQSQPPQTTASCDNMEPRDRLDRMRISKRPGTVKSFNNYLFGT